jgi:hypothetical protein
MRGMLGQRLRAGLAGARSEQVLAQAHFNGRLVVVLSAGLLHVIRGIQSPAHPSRLGQAVRGRVQWRCLRSGERNEAGFVAATASSVVLSLRVRQAGCGGMQLDTIEVSIIAGQSGLRATRRKHRGTFTGTRVRDLPGVVMQWWE